MIERFYGSEVSDMEDILAGLAGDAVAKENPGTSSISIILDLMLPQMSGLEVCKTLKGDIATRHIPIIMLTAKAEEVDKIVGLELGADDYVTKPFSPRELILRINRSLRRGDGKAPPRRKDNTLGEIVLDHSRHEVTDEERVRSS